MLCVCVALIGRLVFIFSFTYYFTCFCEIFLRIFELIQLMQSTKKALETALACLNVFSRETALS